MEEQLISFETAKLAKEKGFEIPTLYAYEQFEDGHGRNGTLFSQDRASNVSHGTKDFNRKNCSFCSAPTQSLLQRWLREVHNTHIFIEPIGKSWSVSRFGANINSPLVEEHDSYEGYEPEDIFYTYEDALESSLQQALKLIKNV